jgi:hypothetical protein
VIAIEYRARSHQFSIQVFDQLSLTPSGNDFALVHEQRIEFQFHAWDCGREGWTSMG